MTFKKHICKGTGKAKDFGCGKEYNRKTSLDKGLCNKCYQKWLFESKEGQKLIEKSTLKAKKNIEKIKKEEIKKMKSDLLTKSDYEKVLQGLINSVVRLIDTGKKCISCNHGEDGIWTRQKHASHYFSVGSHPSLRFNLHNIHASCSICNNWKGGNIKEYQKGLIELYGIDYMSYVKSLETLYPEIHISIHELKNAIGGIKTIKKDILKGIDYTRSEINEKLGIYKINYNYERRTELK